METIKPEFIIAKNKDQNSILDLLHYIDKIDCREILNKKHAILLRGWHISSKNISEVLQSMKLGKIKHDINCSAGPRLHVKDGVFTANEAPATEYIPIHHEMAQCVDYPKYIAFYCDVPAEKGGCTPIIRSSYLAKVFKEKYFKIYNKIKECGLYYGRSPFNVLGVPFHGQEVPKKHHATRFGKIFGAIGTFCA